MGLAPFFHFGIVQDVSKNETRRKREARLHSGATLAAVRTMRGEKQQTLPRKTQHVSEGFLANLETGRRQPSAEALRELAAVLDVKVEVLGRILREGEQWCDGCGGAGVVATATPEVAA